MASQTLAAPVNLTMQAFSYAVSLRYGVVLFYDDPLRVRVMKMIKKIRADKEMVLGDNEAYQIYMAVKNTQKVRGDIAEVGVYQGGSATIICEAKGEKKLHLFDTFAGLPEITKKDNPQQFAAGQFLAGLSQVKQGLKKYEGVHFYPGLFPTTAAPIKNKKFSFVNLDVDLYKSTRDCLEFFYPRLSKGGILISHDYGGGITARGVRQAVDGFFKDKPEPVIELSGSQCLIVKL